MGGERVCGGAGGVCGEDVKKWRTSNVQLSTFNVERVGKSWRPGQSCEGWGAEIIQSIERWALKVERWTFVCLCPLGISNKFAYHHYDVECING